MKTTFQFNFNDPLDMFKQFLEQLESMRGSHQTKEQSDYLEADIRGYKEVIESGSAKNAEAFMAAKKDAILRNHRFKNNEAIVEHLKSIDHWEYKQ